MPAYMYFAQSTHFCVNKQRSGQTNQSLYGHEVIIMSITISRTLRLVFIIKYLKWAHKKLTLCEPTFPGVWMFLAGVILYKYCLVLRGTM